ncbi:MAG: hypothetical protein K9M81_02580 [Chthoniobacterales bacterium]|nr:hypothetical protein [Chthoniobacterales bacterium]
MVQDWRGALPGKLFIAIILISFLRVTSMRATTDSKNLYTDVSGTRSDFAKYFLKKKFTAIDEKNNFHKKQYLSKS